MNYKYIQKNVFFTILSNMNVSHEHKIIWWAPERTASKITAQILKNFNFEYYENSNTIKKLCEPYHTHEIDIPKGCEDYKVICNMRNPYDRVLSLFLNFTSVGMNSVLTKDKRDNFINRFDYFLNELYFMAIKKNKIQNLERNVPIKKYISVLNFTGKIPDYFIRTENLIKDLSNLDFITESDMWKSGQIHELIDNNNFKVKRSFSFDEVFTLGGANKVYQYQKKLFFITGYDPFSFTKNILSNEEKKNFLHETF